MKRNLDTGVEVYDNKAKKKQRHTTNEKPNIYLDIFNKSFVVYFAVILSLEKTKYLYRDIIN